MNTKRLDESSERVQNEGRVLCRALALVVTLAVATLFAILLSGCASLSAEDMARLDALADRWIERLEEKIGDKIETPTPTPEEPTVPGATGDAMDYGLLKWKWGGVNASGAKLDSPRLSGLTCNGRAVSYRWDVGMAGWGLGNGDAGAICAVFFLRDGAWIGGKFDWVSVSRSSRELKHCEYYSNWGSSGIKLPWRGKVAFVVVSADGKRRSNVLIAEAR